MKNRKRDVSLLKVIKEKILVEEVCKVCQGVNVLKFLVLQTGDLQILIDFQDLFLEILDELLKNTFAIGAVSNIIIIFFLIS